MDFQRDLNNRELLPVFASNPVVDVSVVVPAYNEEGNLEILCAELTHALDSVNLSWEVILVDDGSTDRTWATIINLNQADHRTGGLRLSRNFGHQYALLAGLNHAAGRAVISLDADLQHPPELIPAMLAAWQNGAKVVHTLRNDPADVPFLKRLTSGLFYQVFSFLTGVRLEPGMADFRLIDRQVLNHILKLREEGLFLRGVVQWVGFPSVSLPFDCRKRHSGSTKYTLRKMLKFAWNGISSFSLIPLRMAIIIGFVTSILSFAGIVYALFSKFVIGHAVAGWASTIAITSFLFGVLFILLGIQGEYLGRILLEVRHRPRYLVCDTAGERFTPAGVPTASSRDHVAPS